MCRSQELRTVLGTQLPATVLFEHGNIRALCSHLQGSPENAPSAVAPRGDRRVAQAAGFSGSYPGRLVDPARMARLRIASGDSVSSRPRWEHLLPRLGSHADNLRHGGLLARVDLFDNAAFALTKSEAKTMDPQQRMLLEHGYLAFGSVGTTRTDLLGSDHGVFLGITNADFYYLHASRESVFSSTGGSLSIAAGRISYALGMQGPCLSVDTACSSALVAMSSALSSVQTEECSFALTMAVSLMLSPHVSLFYALAGLLSQDGRCKTFDARSNGYVRGEGVGTLILGCEGLRVRACVPLAVGASVVRQDGSSASLTAPNGSAQVTLLRATITRAAWEPTSVDAVETHGTGTALGDPTESNALEKAYTESRVILSGVKASTGHLEPAAGLVGLAAAANALACCFTAGSAHLRCLNPLLKGLRHPSFQTQTLALRHNHATVHGLSSFSYNGTISHALVQNSDPLKRPAEAPRLPSAFRRRSFEWEAASELRTAPPLLQSFCASVPRAERKVTPTQLAPRDVTQATRQSVGIHALEMYTPRHAVHAQELEEYHGTPGKYTRGLLMDAYAGCGSDEDPVSLAHTAVRRLMARFGVALTDVGMLQVASESLIDRSKSMKTELMHIFEEVNTSIEGIDNYNACYGGTAALLSCTNWVQSDAWDGRWAIAVPTDICDATAQYPFFHGAAAVAMLVGPDAPLRLDSQRASHIVPRWDFYKPAGWDVMAPIMDGPGSVEVYHECLTECRARYLAQVGGASLHEEHDFLVYHPASGYKFAYHVFERIVALDTTEGSEDEYVSDVFQRRVAPSLRLFRRIGLMHSASVHANMVSLLSSDAPLEVNTSILLFSYGSGSASSMFRLRLERNTVQLTPSLDAILDSRTYHSPSQFEEICAGYAESFGRFGWTSTAATPQLPEACYLRGVDALGRRTYEWISNIDGMMIAPKMAYGSLVAARKSAALAAQKSPSLQATCAARAMVPLDEDVLGALQELATEMIGDDVDADASLLDAGLDSLSALEFRGLIQQRFPQVTTPATVAFDFPTLRHIEQYLKPSSMNSSVLHEQALRQNHTSTAVGGYCMTLPASLDCLSAMCDMINHEANVVDEMPAARWPDAVDASARWGGCLSAAERFDPKRFAIPPLEVVAMDPQQRLLLEHGYLALHRMGGDRRSLGGTLTGVFVGIGATEWVDILRTLPAGDGMFAQTGFTFSIASGRISFALGLHGPSVSFETACSSALVATHSALRHFDCGDCHNPLACGVNLMLTPYRSSWLAAVGMMSASGRCRTFDARADGFVRSEACCAVALIDEHVVPGCASVLGSAVRQDGKSANLTAPNGQGQRTLLRAAVADARVDTSALYRGEVAANGSPLGDPIDVDATTETLGGADRVTPLLLCGIKANMGHSEFASGLVGLLCLVSSLQCSSSPRNANLRVLSCLVGTAIRERRCTIPVQIGQSGASASATTGSFYGTVASYGYSGTIASTLAHLSPSCHMSHLPEKPGATFKRVAFPWIDATHPLLGQRVRSAEPGALFRSPAAGAMLAVVGDHIVLSTVVMPAAGYMEMGRAGYSLIRRSAGPVTLKGVFFLRPMAVEVDVWVDCSFGARGELQVVSGRVTRGQIANPTVHCTSDAARSTGVGALTSCMWPDELSHFEQRPIGAVYDACVHLGLEWGPQFRTMEALWVYADAGEAAAHLRRRIDQQGTRVHPADLDGALQVNWVMQQWPQICSPASEPAPTILPVALDEACMREAQGKLSVVVTSEASVPTIILASGAEHSSRVQLNNLHLRRLQHHPTAPVSPSESQPVRRIATEAVLAGFGISALLDMAGGLIGDAVDADSPLMEAGLTSVGAIHLRNELQRSCGEDQTLPTVLIFEMPTVRHIAAWFEQRPAAASADVKLFAGADFALVSLVSASVRLPSGCNKATGLLQVSTSGADLITEVASGRWNHPAVVPPMRHGGFIHQLQYFDHAVFKMSAMEAGKIDPQQRQLLESAHEAFRVLGSGTVDDVAGRLTGIFLAIGAIDWWEILHTHPASSSVYAATGANHAVASGRISYALGLQGPCVSYDTACSAGLVATHAALRALQLYECTAGLDIGINVMLTPSLSLWYAAQGTTSPHGRCHTFDTRADGYARSEACVTVSLSATSDRAAKTSGLALAGSAVRQDGRSASLTAPNGQAQQALLRAARGDTSPSDEATDNGIEAHGTGTALGDPVEMRSLAAVMLAGPPLCIVSGIKANCGHAEPAAGTVGLINLSLRLQACSRMPTNAQLRALNPLVADAAGTECAFATQCAAEGAGTGAAHAGVSSFGVGGTIAHTIICVDANCRSRVEARCYAAAGRQTGIAPMVYQRRAYLWHDQPHPFTQHRLSHSGLDAEFRSPASALISLAADHLIQGRVIFPGAGSLEMARVAAAASVGPNAQRGIFFLQPLVVEVAGLVVECSIATGRFEVRSGALAPGAEVLEGAAVHCSGALEPKDVRKNTISEHVMLRSTARLGTAADVGAFYDAYSAVGLQYGPAYRTLARAWSGTDAAAARLLARVTRQGTHVHPADLDDALCLSALVPLQSVGSSETRLTFSMDLACLRGEFAPRIWAAAERQDTEGSRVSISQCARIDGIKTRALNAVSSASQQTRWHHTIEWSHVTDDINTPAEFDLLMVGHTLHQVDEHLIQRTVGSLASSNRRAIAVCSSWTGARGDRSVSELQAVEAVMAILRMQATMLPPVWLCTTGTVPVSLTGSPTHSGLWGLARSCRSERHASAPIAACVDLSDGVQGIVPLFHTSGLRLPGGSVRGLQLSASHEPEAAYVTGALHVPRIEAPYGYTTSAPGVAFETLCYLVDEHTSGAVAALDITQLQEADAELEALCQQHIHEAVRALPESTVPRWHHKLLLAWCAWQSHIQTDRQVEANDVLGSHRDLWPQVRLSERCGPRLADALSGAHPYQELLFPNGSMEAVLPVYEDAVGAAFYNACVVGALESVLALLPSGHRIVTTEVGAGSGGTASSILPVLEGACERYVFTDVSKVFLRQARVRFTAFAFIEFALLNIDADPRLQGFCTHQADLIISTNCLHATPFMCNTLRHCEQLLCDGGVLFVNDTLITDAFFQITFGLTDGWWLFCESCDPDRVGQGSPLMSYRQWQALLSDSGFHATHCMQGSHFLRRTAVIVAQRAHSRLSCSQGLKCTGALLTGGLGGLGLLTARFIVQADAPRLLALFSRSGRVQVSSELDWNALVNDSYNQHIWCPIGDACQSIDISATLRECDARQLVMGIWHMASAFGEIASHTGVAGQFAPKVGCAQHLHLSSMWRPLHSFNMCSSAASLLPCYARGQPSYAAANAWLVSFSSVRRKVGMRASSIAWGHLDIGITERARLTQ